MTSDSGHHVALWKPVLFAALAGGMAWGIRGQYGHESGAMIAGLLVSLVIVLLFAPHARALTAARIVALCTVAMGFGGTETYGQTIGLTQNPNVVGNWEALRWGMLGLAIKGGTWIGFAGVFLGMGLGGKRYRAIEMFLVMLGALLAYKVGVLLLNAPFDPANKLLPRIYFSEGWYWQPDKTDLKPRYEAWGGILFALAFVIAYCASLRKDALAWRLGLWGFLGGALGFPLGQCLQAYHAWNPEVFHRGIWVALDPHMNWWNMMETTFGTVMGATLGLGAWLHRKRVQPDETANDSASSIPWEFALLAVHGALLVMSEFVLYEPVAEFYDLGLIMGVIPMVAIVGGRWWPYLIVFPVTLLPIAGKTVAMLGYEMHALPPAQSWVLYGAIPMLIGIAVFIWFARGANAGKDARWFAARTLLICGWMYFLLNFAVFRFPWPWTNWTARTPNAIIFAICIAALSGLSYTALRRNEPGVTR